MIVVTVALLLLPVVTVMAAEEVGDKRARKKDEVRAHKSTMQAQYGTGQSHCSVI